MSKKINSFSILKSNIPASGESRQFTITGDVGAEFMLQVFDASTPIKFYNFNSKSFSVGFNSEKNLRVNMTSGSFSGFIKFPATTSTYTILLFAAPDTDTELVGGFKSKHMHSVSISQPADVQLTFGLSTVNTNTYSTSPPASNITSTISPTYTATNTVDIDWTVNNKETDANGFGLRLGDEQPHDSYWFFEETETVDGNNSDDTSIVVVDDTTNLIVGMELKYITGTTAPGAATYITNVDTSTKTLTLSRNQALTDGHTMTFRAYGSQLIEDVLGLTINFGSGQLTPTALTKTVRSTSSGNDIALNGTYGVAGGGFVEISGAFIVNTSENKIQVVTPSSSAGGITMQVGQVVKQGSIIHFTGCTQQVNINTQITISQFPSSNNTIYLDLDKFITPGISGS